jgi:GMP synthase-like glutamine amidotransferase
MQAICVTGSKHDAYAKDEWNLKLQELLRTAFDRQQRILGICFGCQTMAIVLGGRVGESLPVLFASRMLDTTHTAAQLV